MDNKDVPCKKLPSYLLENGIEFFALNNQAFMLMKGKVLEYKDFPTETIELIESELMSDVSAQNGLSSMGIPFEEWNIQYIICKYGVFDTKADIEPDGTIAPERYECGKRGICPGENKVCKILNAPFGDITPRLETALKCIAEGMLDKEGADKMHISEHTFKNHRRKLQKIIGTHNKAGLAAFAVSKNLI